MNWKSGLFRIWIVVSVGWMFPVAAISGSTTWAQFSYRYFNGCEPEWPWKDDRWWCNDRLVDDVKALWKRPETAKQWDEIADSTEFQKLPLNQRTARRTQYFDQVVAPKLPAANRDSARHLFESSTTLGGRYILLDDVGPDRRYDPFDTRSAFRVAMSFLLMLFSVPVALLVTGLTALWIGSGFRRKPTL